MNTEHPEAVKAEYKRIEQYCTVNHHIVPGHQQKPGKKAEDKADEYLL